MVTVKTEEGQVVSVAIDGTDLAETAYEVVEATPDVTPDSSGDTQPTA